MFAILEITNALDFVINMNRLLRWIEIWHAVKLFLVIIWNYYQ